MDTTTYEVRRTSGNRAGYFVVAIRDAQVSIVSGVYRLRRHAVDRMEYERQHPKAAS